MSGSSSWNVRGTHILISRWADRLTFDVKKLGLGLNFVVVSRYSISHSAAVVSSGRLLDPLENQTIGVIYTRENHSSPGVIMAILLQDLALQQKELE